MSDTWYREAIPPYEDWQGNLWTVDGECLNPIHGCEEPAWMQDVWLVELQAELMMGFREKLGL